MATNLRIIPSEEEASLHPRAIWNHWQKNVIWDPRSYYGVLEFSGALICCLAIVNVNEYQGGVSRVWYTTITLFLGLMLLVPIAALHWYSNARLSSSILTRSKTHIAVLLSVAVVIFVSHIISIITTPECSYSCSARGYIETIIWLSTPILLIAAYVVYRNARNPRKDPILAELPSPIDLDYPEDESRRAWAESTIADGIEDDSLEPEGQLRL